MSSSHNSSGQAATAVPNVLSAGDATVDPSKMISSLGSNSAGWLNELNQLGYVPNTATASPMTVGGIAGSPAQTGTTDATAGNGAGNPSYTPVANILQADQQQVLGGNSGNTSLLQLLAQKKTGVSV
jgi:hypothetical protein